MITKRKLRALKKLLPPFNQGWTGVAEWVLVGPLEVPAHPLKAVLLVFFPYIIAAMGELALLGVDITAKSGEQGSMTSWGTILWVVSWLPAALPVRLVMTLVWNWVEDQICQVSDRVSVWYETLPEDERELEKRKRNLEDSEDGAWPDGLAELLEEQRRKR